MCFLVFFHAFSLVCLIIRVHLMLFCLCFLRVFFFMLFVCVFVYLVFSHVFVYICLFISYSSSFLQFPSQDPRGVLSLQLMGYLIKRFLIMVLPQSCFVVRTSNKPPFGLQVKSTASKLSCVVSTMLGISSYDGKINYFFLKIKRNVSRL